MRAYVLSARWNEAAVQQVRKFLTEMRHCRHGRAYTLVTIPRDPMVTRVLPRGNWQDESGEIVQPIAPHFLPQIPNADGHRLTRLDLAKWLVSPENPLTARAVVNRFWKQLFGTGLSAVVDDLGVQGQWPVHPELLDWLACEFRDGAVTGHESSDLNSRITGPRTPNTPPARDPKHILKLMVMSSTYPQESNPRPDL